MKVKDLIDILKKFPSDSEVFVDYDSYLQDVDFKFFPYYQTFNMDEPKYNIVVSKCYLLWI